MDVLALQLNGRSSVLRCNYGMALAKMGKPAEALAVLEEAIAADPANPLARFERAGVLLLQERFEDALSELQSLRVGLSLSIRPSLSLMNVSLSIGVLHGKFHRTSSQDGVQLRQ